MEEDLRWSIKEVSETTSTQAMAGLLAAQGAVEGTVISASSQSEGRGRFGRTWVSPVGGLYLSVVLRPSRARRVQVLPLVATFAVVDGIKNTTRLSPRVRWPNDITIAGKKVSGVIAESSYSDLSLDYVVLGVGINCNVKKRSLEEGAIGATSLSEELGVRVRTKSLRDAVLAALGRLYRRWKAGEDLVGSRARDFSTPGRRLELRMKTGGSVYCVAEGVRGDGALIAREGRRRRVFHAEDVERVLEVAGGPRSQEGHALPIRQSPTS